MSLQLSVYQFKCCCLSLAFFLIRGKIAVWSRWLWSFLHNWSNTGHVMCAFHTFNIDSNDNKCNYEKHLYQHHGWYVLVFWDCNYFNFIDFIDLLFYLWLVNSMLAASFTTRWSRETQECRGNFNYNHMLKKLDAEFSIK